MILQDIIRKRPGKQVLFFIFLSLGLFLLSNLPMAINVKKTPPDRIFPYYHGGAPYDYNVYLSVITLGKNGYWLNRDAFTSEKTKPGIFYFYYILVGKMAKLASLWQPAAYHLARILAVGLFLTAVFLVCREIGGRHLGFWSSILALTATISPPAFFGEKGAYVSYTPWWNQLEALRRLDGLPHHLFGQAMFLFSMFCIFKFIKNNNFRLVVIGSILIVITGFFYPPAMLPITFMLPAAVLISIILDIIRKKKFDLNQIFTDRENLGSGIFTFSSLIPLLISYLQTKQGHPWTVWIAWEINKWNLLEPNFNRALLFSFGILLLISVPAVVETVKKNNRHWIFISLWAYMPFILLPFVNFLRIGKLRLIGSVPFLPLSLLSIYSLNLILKSKSSSVRNTVLALFIILTSLPVGMPSFFREITSSRNIPFYSNIYIFNYIWQTIDYIQKNIPRNSIILSNDSTGNILAAYAPVKVYFGHINQTMNFEEKQTNVRSFYSKRFSDREALAFLKKNNIRYVFSGPDEYFEAKVDYPFLKTIFQEGPAVLYQVD